MSCMAKLLIVDTDDHLNRWFQELFGMGGFDTQGTWSGEEALRLLGGLGPFDVVLVDDYLPDLFVGEFLERAGRLPTRPRIVVMHQHGQNHRLLHRYQSRGICTIVDKNDPIKVRAAVSNWCSSDLVGAAN